MHQLISRTLSAIAWAGFLTVIAWTAMFLADVSIPRTVSGPQRTSTPTAILIDLALLGLFAVQHSLMARRTVKAWLRRSIPAHLERTVYVLAADVCLAVLLVLWQPWGAQVWSLHGAAAVAVWAVYAVGWSLAVAATNAVDQLELTGLRQAGWAPPRPEKSAALQTGGLHAVVRHPLMLGLLLAFWATPHMSAGHLFLAVAMTGYVLAGIHFEERDLLRTFGTAYYDYSARVPALIPGWRPAASRHSEAESRAR